MASVRSASGSEAPRAAAAAILGVRSLGMESTSKAGGP
jgi:hypothetical protein